MSGPRALAATSGLLLLTMLASMTPTPLYPAYREQWGLDDTQVSWIFAGYPVGVMIVLVVLGGLSDRIGRVPTLRAGAALLIAALTILAVAPSLEVLVAGRVVQGMATGLITGAGAAALMDLHPRGARAGTARNTLLLACGIALGPLLAGQATTHLPGPLVAPFAVVIALLLVPFAALVPRVPRPAGDPADTGPARLVRTIRVPRTILRPFVTAALSVASTNVTFAVLGGFGPEVIAATDSTSPTVVGGYVSAVLVVVAATQVAARGRAPATCMQVGAAATAAGWGLGAWATSTGSGPLIAATVPLLGVGAGLGLYASAAHIALAAPVARRAEVYSAYLLAAFAALSTAALGLGAVVDAAGIVTATVTTTAISAALLLLIVPLASRR